MRYRSALFAIGAGFTLAACGDDGAGPNRRAVSVSFSSQSPTQAAIASMADVGFDVTVTGGGITLVITKAQVVVRRIKLKPAETAACADDDTSNDACEDLSVGPVLVTLPLTANAVTSIAAQVPEGTYRRIVFKIHKPGDGDAAEIAFVNANPTFATISMRLEGTFNGSAFVFTTDLNEKQELQFDTPLVVDAANPNVTIMLDVSTWFRSGTTVINPTTANKGQPNENLVKNNIRSSIRAIRDNDRNGR